MSAPNPSAPKRALLLAAGGGREECEELSELAAVSGYFCPAMHSAAVRRPKAATYIGEGVITAAGELAEKFKTEAVIVGADLSSVQARNLEARWGVRVIDRTDLILEIFSVRARAYESKLQVELARSRRRLGRLAGQWTHLERQRGGIGLRGGPGEKQIEIDRRLLSAKIKKIERKIESMAARNMTARARRAKNGVLTAALVGYTNAGKSTLFNALTRAGMSANPRPFDTVDSTARRIFIDGTAAVVSDTVGFIRNLPHELLAGFRATLQEAAAGDVIAVVADAACPDCGERLSAVHSTLDAIGAAPERRLLVMNKIDKIGVSARTMRGACGTIREVWLSGRRGEGVAGLRRALQEAAKNAAQEKPENTDENQSFFSEPTARY